MEFHKLVWASVGCCILALVALNAPAVNRKFISFLESRDVESSAVRIASKNSKLEITCR